MGSDPRIWLRVPGAGLVLPFAGCVSFSEPLTLSELHIPPPCSVPALHMALSSCPWQDGEGHSPERRGCQQQQQEGRLRHAGRRLRAGPSLPHAQTTGGTEMGREEGQPAAHMWRL